MVMGANKHFHPKSLASSNYGIKRRSNFIQHNFPCIAIFPKVYNCMLSKIICIKGLVLQREEGNNTESRRSIWMIT